MLAIWGLGGMLPLAGGGGMLPLAGRRGTLPLAGISGTLPFGGKLAFTGMFEGIPEDPGLGADDMAELAAELPVFCAQASLAGA